MIGVVSGQFGQPQSPSSGGGGGGITEITSEDDSVTITNPEGPTVDLSVSGGGGGWPTDDGSGSGNLQAATSVDDTIGYQFTDNGTSGFVVNTNNADGVNGIQLIDNTPVGIDIVVNGGGPISFGTGAGPGGFGVVTGTDDTEGIVLDEQGSGGITINKGFGTGGITIETSGGGATTGISLTTQASDTGGIVLEEGGMAGITISSLGPSGITLDTSSGSGGINLSAGSNEIQIFGVQVLFSVDQLLVGTDNGITLSDNSTAGISIEEDGASDITVTATSTGNIALVQSGTGNILMTGLPTTDPAVASAVWNSNGALVLSGFAPWEFPVGPPSGSDDTATINTAISNAVTYAEANDGYAEVIFDTSTPYLIDGDLQQNATPQNSQIPLPVIGPTAQKITLVLRGGRDASAIPWVAQTVAQRSGAVLLSNNTSGTNDPTYGEASVIGGPTLIGGVYGPGSGLYSNMLLVVDGVSIVVPDNPTVCGFDLRCLAQANIISSSVQADAAPGSITVAENDYQFGVAMPVVGNNDNCNVQNLSIEGQYIGFMPSEHTTVESIRCVYCVVGVAPNGGGSSTPHAMHIKYASVEACSYVLLTNSSFGDNPVKLTIDCLDVETDDAPWNTLDIVYDTESIMQGTVHFRNVPATLLVSEVNSGTDLDIICDDERPGSVTAPDVPTTTTALLNPFFRNAMVAIVAGIGVAVSAIAVDGVDTGLSLGVSSDVVVMVPTNRTITLTYSGGTPTWTWTLLS